ncbi:MAG: MFS transporter [Planctomycetes bacterium]|nr:MFS transporter [Planctomycetota bacterium]
MTANTSPAPILKHTLTLPSAAWIMYDTANTVYAAVLTFVFIPHLGELFDDRAPQGIIMSASMIVAGLLVPVFASASDRTGRARLYLILTTVACIVAMALFGVTDNRVIVLGAFFIANLAYNASLVFYNSLLPSVASEDHQGLVSGLGVGLGYVGTIAVLVLFLFVFKDAEPQLKFFLAALLFLALALPCFLLVKERRVQSREKLTLTMIKQQFSSVAKTIKSLPQNRHVMWFLIGNFFCVDVLNTAILFFGDFTRGSFFVQQGEEWVARGGELSIFGLYKIESVGELLLIAGLSMNVFALIFGVTLGFLTDKLGSLKMLRLSAGFLVLGLLAAALASGVSVTWYLVGICVFGALGLAGIWTAGRKLLIELSPPEKLGEYFGLYGITTKLSVIGAVAFGVVFDQVNAYSGNDLLGWKIAIGTQAIPLMLGLIFLFKVKLPANKAAA